MDLFISSAPTQICNCFLHRIGIDRFVLALPQKGRCGDNLSGLAIATLRDLKIDPSVNQLFSEWRRNDSFNGLDFSVADGIDRQDARACHLAIDDDGAGTAGADAAPEFCAGQA